MKIINKLYFADKLRHTIFIFIGVFFISVILFGIRWNKLMMIDSGMWADQAEYVLLDNPKEFDYLFAYGHPGGPIIEGTIILNKIFGLDYDRAVVIFAIFICSFFVALACALCFLMKKERLWWFAVFVTLVFNWMLGYGTPPSIISTILVTFLCLFTLYLYENTTRFQTLALVVWGVVAGLSVATRADIGVVTSAFFLFILLQRINWRKLWLIISSALISFIIFDPFMWFMPIRHIKDLVFKFTYHYSDFMTNHLSLVTIITISSITFLSIMMCMYFISSGKRIGPPLVAPLFLRILIIMTGGLYTIFLSSKFQTERYFLPILFIWEVFFPLFIFSLIDKTEIKSKNFIKILIIVLLISFYITHTSQNVFVSDLPILL